MRARHASVTDRAHKARLLHPSNVQRPTALRIRHAICNRVNRTLRAKSFEAEPFEVSLPRRSKVARLLPLTTGDKYRFRRSQSKVQNFALVRSHLPIDYFVGVHSRNVSGPRRDLGASYSRGRREWSSDTSWMALHLIRLAVLHTANSFSARQPDNDSCDKNSSIASCDVSSLGFTGRPHRVFRNRSGPPQPNSQAA